MDLGCCMDDNDIMGLMFEVRASRKLCRVLADAFTAWANGKRKVVQVAGLNIIDWSGGAVDTEEFYNVTIQLVLDGQFFDTVLELRADDPHANDPN